MTNPLIQNNHTDSNCKQQSFLVKLETGECIIRHISSCGEDTFTTLIGDTITTPIDLTNATPINTNNRTYVDTCWLPDQYAIQWSWGGNGDLSSYNPITGVTTYWGKTEINSTVVGGYALAFKNDAVEPTLYFQVGGKLYKADPADPISTFTIVGPTSLFSGTGPGATSSYPCFDYIDGSLLVGDGNQAWEIDETTGASTYLGKLKDIRDGANLSVSPGDWFSDPNGDWYMMARDNRGAMFINPVDSLPYCTGTVLWKIDKQTLEATRISSSCSPVSGTGASWLAANIYLLSVGTGQVYQYNKLTDQWTIAYDADTSSDPLTNITINDLAPQWIVPNPIPVFGWIDNNCPSTNPDCTPTLFTLEQQLDNTLLCKPFTPTTSGKFQCEKDPNPFVSDPFDNSSSGGSFDGCKRCPDEEWNKGCSDAGPTLWRRYYDESGNQYIEYYYGALTETTNEAPSGFTLLDCNDSPNPTSETTAWCNQDISPSVTVYRKEYSNGTIVWYDDTGTILEPTNKLAGECPSTDPLLPVTNDIICFEGTTYTRVRKETYIPNVDGVPELSSFQIVWYNEDGVFYDSTVLPAGSTYNEPGSFYFGDCNTVYQEIKFEKLCEGDDEKLLLIDSGGAFAEYSFYDGSVTNINTLSVPSSGGSADPDNFRLYSYVAGTSSTSGNDSLFIVDVNTKQLIQEIDLFTNDGSPTTFSAASFNVIDGFLYSRNGTSLYKTNVTTGEVSKVIDFSQPIAGGSSMAIDANGRITAMGSPGSTIYEIDPNTGIVSVLYVITTANVGNGSTFNANTTDPVFYATSGNNTVAVYGLGSGNETEELIIDSWPPGANSLAFYRTLAQKPSCFFRKFGIPENPNENPVYISDHYISDFSPRVISGSVICCECGCGESSSSSSEITKYTTTFDSQFFTSALTVPSAPLDTKEVVVFNDSNAWLELSTNYGTQIVPPNGTIEFSINNYESAIVFTSVSIISGTFSASDRWAINYKTQF